MTYMRNEGENSFILELGPIYITMSAAIYIARSGMITVARTD